MREITLDSIESVGGALGHKGRLRILALLRDADLYVCQIKSVLGLAGSTVSVHLAVLRRGGLITEQKQGRFVEYRLTDQEPLGSVAREILYLVKDDPQVVADARLLEAVRRLPLDRLCRAGCDLATAGIAGRAERRRRPAPARAHRVSPAAGSR